MRTDRPKPPTFRLRFPHSNIPAWAARFPAAGPTSAASDDSTAAFRPTALARGYLTRAEFLALCEWKSPRTRPRCRENTKHAVETITRAAFATDDEALKIDLLCLLRGVDYPTASTILHFCDARPYPILDVRALWSLGYDKPPRYTTEFWLAYVAYTRALAARLNLDMRTLDKALWQYSKERQR